MIGKTDPHFWKCFDNIPADIQQFARKKYQLWALDPFHPSLHFKELSTDLWSVRINQQYRALGRRNGELLVWFWIGTHAEYDQLVAR